MSEVDEQLALANEALHDLEHMEDVSLRRRYTTLYFAAYHAVRGVLLRKEYAPKTHSGTDSLVHNILYREEELLSKDEAALFSKLKTRREQADYETEFLGTEDEFTDLKPQVEQLVQKIRAQL